MTVENGMKSRIVNLENVPLLTISHGEKYESAFAPVPNSDAGFGGWKESRSSAFSSVARYLFSVISRFAVCRHGD